MHLDHCDHYDDDLFLLPAKSSQIYYEYLLYCLRYMELI